MNNQGQEYNIHELAEKWMQGKLNPEEEAYFEKWYASFDDSELQLHDSKYGSSEQLKTQIYKRILTKSDSYRKTKSRFDKAKVAAVVSMVCLSFLSTVLIYTYFIGKSGKTEGNGDAVTDIGPGTNKAYLTLGNGIKIDLSSDHEGLILTAEEWKYSDGSHLDVRGMASEGETMYQMLSTPVGGQYQLVLPDCTKVWLNASSSLRFPLKFSGKERTVELSGEAYFEVGHSGKPFKVKTARQEIEVLGTHFNISSYADDAQTRTTLLEGSVRVTANSSRSSRLLSPGQQALLRPEGLEVEDVDAESVVAWKNGLFVFDDEPLESILKKVARWYDVQIIYENGVDKRRLFGGSVSRYDNVSKVLEKLELTGGVHFMISVERQDNDGTERRVTVMK